MDWSPALMAAIRSGRPVSEWSPEMVAELEATQQTTEPLRPVRGYEPGLPAGAMAGHAASPPTTSTALMDELLGPRRGPPAEPSLESLLPSRPAPIGGGGEPAYMARGGGGGAGAGMGPPAPPPAGAALLERWQATPTPTAAAASMAAAPAAAIPPAAPAAPALSAATMESIMAKNAGTSRGFRHPDTLSTKFDKITGGEPLATGVPEEVAPAADVARRDKEDQLRRFEMVKGISDALGSFYAPTASEILLNQPRREPTPMAEPSSISRLREELAGESDPKNDPTSDASRRYQELAAQLFPGMDLSSQSASEISDVLPFLDRAAGRQQEQAQFDARAAQQGQAGPTTQKDREALDAYQTAKKEWEQIRELKKKVNTGPVVNAWKSAWEAVGFPDVEWSTFKANLAGRINAHIKAMTGAQMSEPEARRLAQEMPKTSDADELFMSKLESVMRRVDAAHDSWLRTRGMEGATPAAGAATGAQVLVRDPKGKLFKLPESQLEEALAQGYTRG